MGSIDVTTSSALTKRGWSAERHGRFRADGWSPEPNTVIVQEPSKNEKIRCDRRDVRTARFRDR
ncbi:MAG TPA: hypothetical protein PK708_14575, partial [Candidatus Competibacter sp.]|nr:hypothetical protein [Candidatus Competibacter sp.]